MLKKNTLLQSQAQRAAEIKEQSHLKFAHGVIFMAQNLKEVKGNYLAQVEDFLDYADDEESRKAIRVLYDDCPRPKHDRGYFRANCGLLCSRQ